MNRAVIPRPVTESGSHVTTTTTAHHHVKLPSLGHVLKYVPVHGVEHLAVYVILVAVPLVLLVAFGVLYRLRRGPVV